MRVILIRHGKTIGNLEHRYVGSTDESLCQEGMNTLLAYRNRGLYPKVDRIYVSPMKRCIESARIIYPDRAYVYCPELRECDFGCFEYRNYIELNENELYQKWIDSNGTMDFPQGEKIEAFRGRCQKSFERIISASKEETLAFVIHGGSIMSVLHKYALPHKDYFDWQIENGEGFIADVSIDRKNLERIHKLSNR